MGPSAAAAICSLASSTPSSPLPLLTPTSLSSSASPPASFGGSRALCSPRLTSKEAVGENNNEGHHPPLPPIDDQDLKLCKSSLNSLSSFLPIRHLRLRAPEHLASEAGLGCIGSMINKENGFDSSSSSPLPPTPTSTSSLGTVPSANTILSQQHQQS
jgi:hypothetical protein